MGTTTMDETNRINRERRRDQMASADWQPSFSSWRHGGFYVDSICYPSGAVGCVSNNYADGKWRIVCDDRPGSFPGGDNDHTYDGRVSAARAERALALAEWGVQLPPQRTSVAALRRALVPGIEVDLVNPTLPRMNRRATVLRVNSVDVLLSHPDAPNGSHLEWPKKGNVATDGTSFFLLNPGQDDHWLQITPITTPPEAHHVP